MKGKLRFAFFVLVAVVQLVVAADAIVKSELALRTGEAFRFRIQPVDPVDAFRGRYVAIRFEVDRAPVADDLELRSGKHVFVPIEIGADEFATLGWVGAEPPAVGPYLRMRAGVVSPDEEGKRTVFFELNGQPRTVKVQDRGCCVVLPGGSRATLATA